MAGWWSLGGAFLLFFGILLAPYLYKINWIKDLRLEGDNKRILANHLESKKRKLGKLPPVYPNGWFALLESFQLDKLQVKHVAALGQNFAVFRTDNGTVRILDAYCPHLGANMAEGGRVKGDCLECPFHGWQFRGSDGQCDYIPYSDKVPHIARTKTWKCCEANNIIFVWYHAEGLEPNWQPQTVSHVSNRTWRYHGRNEFLINCHIQEVAENGADTAHLSAVHGPMIFSNIIHAFSCLARHSWTNVGWRPHNLLTESKASDDDEPKRQDDKDLSHRAYTTLKHTLVLFEKYKLWNLDVHVQQIGPGYVEMMMDTYFGRICIFQTVTPMEPLLQKVTHLIYAAPLLAPYAAMIFLGECLMFERDVAIWNRKKYEKQPLLVKEDKCILSYRRWYSQFYSQHSPSYHSAMRSLQW
ncbi:cholesterol 7-desaturase nvd isoform X2 [Hylaeus anthracinus]|uniref:cholesterol 7-desaturase nvd isoform X2 n=1 Tax=Hylaeus volcanicus TaxID=313075 RepID=UPI0023B79666|nr:cholesterol 7-desaturase nvd isoform X2 [Hylaeus volcanicus]XP_054011404.1 cholesterol 7-desaturase nvd isoform X2 [Hylaeus anthracinus]